MSAAQKFSLFHSIRVSSPEVDSINFLTVQRTDTQNISAKAEVGFLLRHDAEKHAALALLTSHSIPAFIVPYRYGLLPCIKLNNPAQLEEAMDALQLGHDKERATAAFQEAKNIAAQWNALDAVECEEMYDRWRVTGKECVRPAAGQSMAL